MRAVVCVPGDVEVAEVPDPEPAADEVVVAVEACGLCGSDVHAIDLGMTAPGQILGHEFAGRVVAAGDPAGDDWVGQAIAVNPLGSCGSCRAWLVGDGLAVAGSCAFDDATYTLAVEHIPAGRVPVASLISERLDLDATPDALRRLRTPGELIRILSRPLD